MEELRPEEIEGLLKRLGEKEAGAELRAREAELALDGAEARNLGPAEAEWYHAFLNHRSTKAEIAEMSLDELTRSVTYRRSSKSKGSEEMRQLPLGDREIARAILKYARKTVAESEEPSVPTDPEAPLKGERRPNAVPTDDSLSGKETKPQGPTKSGEFPRDFVLAFGGWFVLHSIYWLLFGFVFYQLGEGAIILMPCLFVPPAINLAVVLILLVRRRKQMVYGVVSAVLVNSIGCLFVVSSDAIFIAISMCPFFLARLL